MAKNNRKTPVSNSKQFKYNVLNGIINQVQIGTGLSLSELKEMYSEDKLFFISLQHVTTTKKAICEAMGIPVEAGCRYKRELQKRGLLVESTDQSICPFTKHPAHLISTNPKEFERLQESNSNQLKLFKDEE